MNDIQIKYYNQQEFWSEDFLKNEAELERIKEIIKYLPEDSNSLLDVGCGNGAMINYIADNYPNKFQRIVGLDLSSEALKNVRTEKYLGFIDNLPFEDSSFDVVTCCEVLEHLPEEIFSKALLELQRVTKKKLLITVPNDEDLESLLVRCPRCSCWFNHEFHIRNFNKETAKDLFDRLVLSTSAEFGPNKSINKYNVLTRLYFIYYKKPQPASYGICPQCGYQKHPNKMLQNKNTGSAKSSNYTLPVLLKKWIRKLVLPVVNKKRWLLVIYYKKEKYNTGLF